MHDLDTELAVAFKAGQTSALEALYWRHAERVWRYARYFSGSEEVAGEIVQESFERVARNLAAFEGRARFTTWLYTVVRSAAIDLTTRMRKAPRTLQEDQMALLEHQTPEPVCGLIGEETRLAVREAVSRLPEAEREAVLLCELQELSLGEACEVLGWSESRIKVTLYRARRRLRSFLKGYVEMEPAKR